MQNLHDAVAMRKRGKLILLLAGVGLASVGFALMWRDREPSYQGKSLLEWLMIYSPRTELGRVRQTPTERQRAFDAVHHIGAEALFCITAWMNLEPKYRVGALLRNMPNRMRQTGPVKWFANHLQTTFTAAYLRAEYAPIAFQVLGPVATPAIPELKKMLATTNSDTKRSRAMYALCNIGPEAMPAIIEVLSDPAHLPRQSYPWSIPIIALGSRAHPLVPVLALNLDSTNREAEAVSRRIFTGLGLGLEPIVLVLTKCLEDPSPSLRETSANALMKFGLLGKSAAPGLVKTLDDPALSVRIAASNALLKIAPEALTNGPVLFDILNQ